MWRERTQAFRHGLACAAPTGWSVASGAKVPTRKTDVWGNRSNPSATAGAARDYFAWTVALVTPLQAGMAAMGWVLAEEPVTSPCNMQPLRLT
jgi:hypothetical protein